MNPTDKRAGYKRAAQLIREWLNEPGNYDEEISIALDRLDNEEFIEKAKYDTVVRERDELKGALELASQDVIDRANERDALKAERDELFALLASGAPRVTITKVDEADAWRSMCEKLAGVLKEIIVYFDKSLEPYGGGQYRLAASDAFERARAALTAFEAFKRGGEGK